MKNSLAEAGIISDPKSFAVGKRHLTQIVSVVFSNFFNAGCDCVVLMYVHVNQTNITICNSYITTHD